MYTYMQKINGSIQGFTPLEIYKARTRLSKDNLSLMGFTMIEVVVMLAIITLLSAVVLFNFTGFNEGAFLNRYVRELSLAIRKAQNMSLAVTQIIIGNPPVPQTPPAIGLQLIKSQSSYFLFADLNPRDNKYTDNGEKIGGDEKFERNIKINNITDENGVSYDSINIIFTSPEANIIFSDVNGVDISNTISVINIQLQTSSGQLTKTISVRSSGQISAE